MERQELYCHNCEMYVRFNLDIELNGQHIIECPNCKHKHYRFILNGEISDGRWGRDPSQDQVYMANNTTAYSFSVYANSTGTTGYTTMLWLNTTCT